MATLEGHHPWIAVRTRSRQPASLLSVILIAAVTLAVAVALAFLIADDDAPAPTASSPSAGAPASQDASAARPGVLTPRVTETPAQPRPVPEGARYDGGPEEGSAFADRLPAPGVRYDGGPEEGNAFAGRSAPGSTDEGGHDGSALSPGTRP